MRALKAAFGGGLFCAMAAATTAHATVYFQNTGNTTGWDRIFTQHIGTVTTVSSPVYKGSTSIRTRQIFQSADGTRYHSEVEWYKVQLNGADRYYGQAMYLQSNHSESAVCQQWATEAPSAPWLGMNTTGTSINWDTVRGPYASEAPATFSTVPRATWFTVVTRLNMKTAGALEIWLNGAKKVSRSGDWSTAYASNSSIRWSTGVYIGWHNKQPTGPSDLSIWHDHIRVASSYAEADPAGWSDGGTSPTPTPTPTSAPNPTPTPRPTASVQLFQGCNYGGWSASFPVGDYTMADIVARGGVNDDASSIRIPAGRTVTLYRDNNFSGTSLTLTGDDSCFTDNNFNDAVSSLRVR